MKKQAYETPKMAVMQILKSPDVICDSNNPYDKDGDGYVDGWY